MNLRLWGSRLLVPLLALSVLATGIGCVYVRHEARKLFVQLQELQTERDRLQIEWGKLRIEQGTWASHGRVENMARSELKMVEPKPGSVMAIR